MRAKNTVEPLIGEADGGGDSGGGFAVEGSLPEQEDGETEGFLSILSIPNLRKLLSLL